MAGIIHVSTLAAANTPEKAIPYATKRLSVSVVVDDVAHVSGNLLLLKSGGTVVTGETESNLRRLLEWSRRRAM